MADADEQQCVSYSDQTPAAAVNADHDPRAGDDEEKAAVSLTPPPTAEHDARPSAAAAQTATSAPRVTVNLKFIHRERLSVQCAHDILVAELKKRVLELYARHVENDGGDVGATAQSAATTPSEPESDMAAGASLRLIYKGKVLKDDQALAAYNFVDEDTIHAVFGRPQTPATSGSDGSEATSTAVSTAASSTTATRDNTGGVTTTTNGVSNLDNGVVVGQFNLDADENAGLPEIGSLLNTILSSFAGVADPEGATTRIRIMTSNALPSVASASIVATSTTASPAAPSTSTTASSAATTAPTAALSTAGTSSAPAPAVSAAPVSTHTPAVPGPVTAIRYSIPLAPPPQAPSLPASVTGNAASLLNQAASLRRMIPALELSPLSQPPELSSEMYALGNAMREAGDTFLAVHRQLQFVATRFLSENNLNASERLRLRTRVHQLVSILDQVGALSRAVSGNLATSSYGPLAQAPPAQTSQSASQPPATTTQTSQPASQEPAPTTSATPTARPTASMSVSPTVNIFSGGNANPPGASAPNVGHSIADILQAVSGLAGGATPTTTGSTTQQSGVPGSLGSLLNFVSALTSNGARPGQSTAASSNGPSVQEPTASANVSQPASTSPENVQLPANSSQQAATTTTAASIPSQPLSTLFAQVRNPHAS